MAGPIFPYYSFTMNYLSIAKVKAQHAKQGMPVLVLIFKAVTTVQLS